VLADGLQVLHYWVPRSDPGGSNVYIFGEIENTTGAEVDAPSLGVVFYDREGNVLGATYALPINHTIPSNRPMPFGGDLFDPPFDPADVGSVELSLCESWGDTYNITNYGYGHDGLEIEDVEEVERANRRFEVTFKVRNTTEQPSNVRAVLAMYDAKGRYCGYEQAESQLTIPAGKTGLFKITAYDFGSTRTLPLQFISGKDYSYEIWVARDDQVWVVMC
jgi:predicted Zn-ribbon and HTH transcriptional regulator